MKTIKQIYEKAIVKGAKQNSKTLNAIKKQPKIGSAISGMDLALLKKRKPLKTSMPLPKITPKSVPMPRTPKSMPKQVKPIRKIDKKSYKRFGL